MSFSSDDDDFKIIITGKNIDGVKIFGMTFYASCMSKHTKWHNANGDWIVRINTDTEGELYFKKQGNYLIFTTIIGIHRNEIIFKYIDSFDDLLIQLQDIQNKLTL